MMKTLTARSRQRVKAWIRLNAEQADMTDEQRKRASEAINFEYRRGVQDDIRHILRTGGLFRRQRFDADKQADAIAEYILGREG